MVRPGAENIQQNLNKMELLKGKPHLIGIQDPRKVDAHQISESRARSKRKRKRKMTKTYKSKVGLNPQEEGVLLSKIRRESANEFYLYRLFYEYHSSLLKEHRNDKRVPIGERNRLNSNPDRIQKASSSIDPSEDDTKLADFIPVLLNKDIIDTEEQRLLEYTLTHRYLSEDIAQRLNSVEPPNKNRIADAINDLISGPEKETFEKLFKRVYSHLPSVISKTSSK
jgi:hypothetical protein